MLLYLSGIISFSSVPRFSRLVRSFKFYSTCSLSSIEDFLLTSLIYCLGSCTICEPKEILGRKYFDHFWSRKISRESLLCRKIDKSPIGLSKLGNPNTRIFQKSSDIFGISEHIFFHTRVFTFFFYCISLY